MSHEATTWAIRQRGLPPAAKLVLWHLCDRYHPDHGCFPSQGTLADDCELSRSTLNTHLALLEERGLIHREARLDPRTKRQASTRYRFPFEEDFPVAAEAEKPCPKSGHGSDEAPQSRVRNSGRAVSGWSDTEPVKITRNISPPKPPLAEPAAADAAGAEPSELTTLPAAPSGVLPEHRLSTGDRPNPEAWAGPVPGSPGKGDPQQGTPVEADPAQGEETALPEAEACDAGPEREDVAGAGAPSAADRSATDRSAAARKAADTRLLNDTIRQWPSGLTERRGRIDTAWGKLTPQERRDAARRVPVYLNRLTRHRRKPGTLARYLADGPWRLLPDPAERPVRAAEAGERRALSEEVGWKFLEHADARELLAAAVSDGLVPYLLGEVRQRHELPTLEDYARLREVWQESRATFQRNVDEAASTIMSPVLRRAAQERALRHEAASARAHEILALAREGSPVREARGQAGARTALRGA